MKRRVPPSEGRDSMTAPVTSLDEVLNVLREIAPDLERQFSARRIGVFGSFVRDEAVDKSDVDILVEFEQPTFDHYMDLKFRLEGALGRPVDLVLRDTLKPRIRPLVEREVVYV